MSCPHCLRGDAENVDILNWDVDNVLDQTESVGLLTVTGGEPLLNLPALQHLANGIARRGIPLMRFQVITNGLIYDESFIVILKRFAEIVHLTQQHGYDHSEREPWRVQVGVSLDRYHAEPEKCKKNYIQYKNALRGYAEVLRVSHGNAPRNEGRAKTLPNTIDFDKIISTYMLQQIEVLSADHKPMCRFFDSYLTISDIQNEYLPISKKKIRILVKKYLPTRMLGNRIFVERQKLEELLASEDVQKLELK